MISRPAILATLGFAVAVTALLAAGGFNSLPPERTVFAQTSEPSLEVEPCLEAAEGETFELDIVARDVTDLLAWEVYFAYDPDILRVVGKDVRLLLATSSNSNVTDFSDPVPNATGLYRMAAADLSLSGAAESGEGVLARVTLETTRRGVSPANIYRADLNNDGAADFGPTLSSSGGAHLADANGNAIFDGAIFSGQIAVGRPCRPVAPTPDPEDFGEVLPSYTPTPTPGQGVPTPAPTETPTPSPTPRGPDYSEPATPPGDDPEASTSPGAPSRTQAGIASPGSRPPPGTGPGGSGGGITPWLISLAGGSAGLGLVITYFVLRTARRPV